MTFREHPSYLRRDMASRCRTFLIVDDSRGVSTHEISKLLSRVQGSASDADIALYIDRSSLSIMPWGDISGNANNVDTKATHADNHSDTRLADISNNSNATTR